MRKPSTLIILLPLLIAALAGCDSSNDLVAPDGGGFTALEGDSFAVIDQEDVYASIEHATIEKAMAMRPVFEGDGSHFTRRAHHPHGPGSHLAPVLRELGLDAAQRMEIREIIRASRGEIRDTLEALRVANQDLIDAANEERRVIIEALQAGEITREEALARLEELNRVTIDAIRANPENDPYLEQLCDIRDDLFEEIRTVLDSTQQQAWDDWVAGLSRSCS